MGRIEFPRSIDAALDEERARSLQVSAVEGVLGNVMIGSSESWLGAFAVALGHENLHLALLSTVPLLFGAAAQLSARALVDKLGGRKRFVVVVAAGQALVHLGLVAIALDGTPALAPLLAVNILYWACGMAVTPAWNAWMGSLTAHVDRGRYFARRSAVATLGMLGAFVVSGLAMEHGRENGTVLTAFAAIAAAGGIARGLSAFTLSRQLDPGEGSSSSPAARPLAVTAPTAVVDVEGGFFDRIRAAVRASTWGVVFFVVAFQLGANIAIPFFLPYMLHTLKLDFMQFMELQAASMLVKPFILPLWARAQKIVGWRALLVAAAVGTGAVAAGWTFATSFTALIFVQFLSGISWGGIELASLQLLLASSPERHRVSFFAVSTSLTAVAQVTGSLLGAALLAAVADHYATVFLVSAGMRALAVVWLILPASLLARRDR